MLERGQVGVGLLRRPQVGLADNLHQRHPAAVEVEVGFGLRFRQTFVQRLARVLLQVQPRNVDAFLASLLPGAAGRNVDFQPAVLGQRPVVLRNLVALGQVRIKIVFAREDGLLPHLTVDCQRRPRRQLRHLPVQHRQRPRQAQADRADVGVGRVAEAGRAAAENLRGRLQLHVDFQADDGLVVRALALGHRRNFLSG